MDQSIITKTANRMTAARAVLVRDLPFFGHLALRLQLACAPCGTACTDGDRIIFDPAFAEKLSDKELQFVILHEIFHCVLDHCTRGRSLLSDTYNIACDIVVNSMILELWGMNTFTVDGEEPMHLAPDGSEGRLFSSEEIYHMLMQKSQKDPGPGSKGRCRSSSGSSKSGKRKPAPGNSGQCGGVSVPGKIDRHDIWKGILDPGRLQDSWNARIGEAIKACGDSTGIPQALREVISGLSRRSQVNWRQLLHDFIQFTEYDYSYLPPDRRFAAGDLLLPAFNVDEEKESVADLWICVDTSGSISIRELSEALAEILDAMRQVNLSGIISFFDSNISTPVPFDSEATIKNLRPTGGGGTSFTNIFRYMEKNMYPELPKAVLIFTDGYAPAPDESAAMGVPVLWLIHKHGKTDFPWGRVVEI